MPYFAENKEPRDAAAVFDAIFDFDFQSLQLSVSTLGDDSLEGVDGTCNTDNDCQGKLVCDKSNKKCKSKLTD